VRGETEDEKWARRNAEVARSMLPTSSELRLLEHLGRTKMDRYHSAVELANADFDLSAGDELARRGWAEFSKSQYAIRITKAGREALAAFRS
jgi:hypothetical protein